MKDGKYSKRHGWFVVLAGTEIFRGEAGDAVLAYDDALHEAESGTLELFTPEGHRLSVAVFPERGEVVTQMPEPFIPWK